MTLDEIRLQQLLGPFNRPQGIASLSQAASPLSFQYVDQLYPFAPANRLQGLDLPRFQGVSELGRQDEDVEQVEYLPGQEPSSIEKLFNKVQNIPGAVRSGLLSLIGKVNPALSFIGGGLSSIVNLPEFFQERRDARARAEAAERGAAKQQEMARQTAFQAMRGNDAYGGGGGRPGGFGQGAGDFSASDPTATEGSF